jgi:hypothetical protein
MPYTQAKVWDEGALTKGVQNGVPLGIPYVEMQEALGGLIGGGATTAAWSGIGPGKPGVTVSNVGLVTGALQVNGGADFGPDTLGTTTGGVQEAYNAVSSSTSPFYGRSVTFANGLSSGVFAFSTQLSVPDNVATIGLGSGGGEGFGPVVVAPYTYLSFTGPSSVTDAIIFNGVAGAGLYGVAAVTTVAGLRSLVRLTGSRACSLSGTFLQANATGVSALLLDGQASGHNSEANRVLYSTFFGDPAVTFGISGEGNHSNDTVWISCIFEGPTGTACGPSNHVIYVATSGGNQQFLNAYSRGTYTAGQTFIDMSNANGGYLNFTGGEMLMGVGNLFLIGGGDLGFYNLSITCSSGPTVGAIFGGQVNLWNVQPQSGTFQYNQAAGATVAGDAYSRVTGTWNWGTLPSTTTNNGSTLSATATTTVVSSSSGIPSAPFYAYIDRETVQVTNVSGTTWTIVRGVLGSTAATHSDGATLYVPGGGSSTNVGISGTLIGGGAATWPMSPGSHTYLPGGRTSDISPNPPVSGTFYGPYAADGFGYFATLRFPCSVSSTQTIVVSISPDGGTTVQNQTPSYTPGVAMVVLVTIDLPGGWSFRLTCAGTISSGTSIGRVSP